VESARSRLVAIGANRVKDRVGASPIARSLARSSRESRRATSRWTRLRRLSAYTRSGTWEAREESRVDVNNVAVNRGDLGQGQQTPRQERTTTPIPCTTPPLFLSLSLSLSLTSTNLPKFSRLRVHGYVFARTHICTYTDADTRSRAQPRLRTFCPLTSNPVRNPRPEVRDVSALSTPSISRPVHQ